MSQTQLGAGKEVLSFCSKCKLALAHIIVNMKSASVIGHVVCNTCKSTHAFKDPNAKKKTPVSSLTRRNPSEKAQNQINIWEKAMKDQNKKQHSYSISAKFAVGDIVNHPKFGPGVVDRVVDNNKIEVIFKQEVKTLIHNT